MKKILALTLSLVLSCSMLAACSEEGNSSSKKDSSSTADSSSVSDSSIADSSTDLSGTDSSKPDSSKTDAELPPSEGDMIILDVAEVEGSTFESLLEALKGGTYTCIMRENGTESLYTTNGTKAYLTTDANSNAETIFQDGTTIYVIDNETKKYAVTSLEESDIDYREFPTIDEVIETYEQIVSITEYVGTYRVSINGKEYNAERRKTSDGFEYILFDGKGAFVGNFSGGKLRASIDPPAIEIIPEALDDYLAIPDGYKEATTDKPSTGGNIDVTADSKYEIGEKLSNNTNLLQPLRDELAKGNQTYEMTYETGGESIDVIYTTDGNAIYSYMELMGSSFTTLRTKDGDYYINHEEKAYYFHPDDAMQYEQEDPYDAYIGDIGKYEASYNFTIDGNSYIAEKFHDSSSGDDAYLIFDDNGYIIAGLSVVDVNDPMFFRLKVSPTAKKELLSVPDGYREVTEDEYNSLLGYFE